MATLRNDTVIKNADGQATSAIITAANIVNHAAGKISSSDTRSVVTTPQTIDKGTVFDFKQNSTESLSDGGTYFGQMTFRPYGTGTDWSGTLSHQLGFADSGNIWQRSGSSTTWGAWKKILNSSNYSGYALPLSGGTLTGGLSGTTAAFSGQITNTIATGTAPFAITSTTLVSNLNVQYLNGQLGGYYAAASSLASYLPLAGGTLTGELVINYAAGRQRIIDGANALIMGHWDTVNVRIEASGRPLYMVSYGGAISIGRSSGSNLVVDTASVSYGGNTVLHAGNYTSYPDATKLPLTGGALTGAITVNGVSDAVVVQTNGNAAQWYGRISVRNSTSDKSSFLGTYQGIAGVFAHNNALNAWADLYVNTVDGTNGGIVRMSADVRIGGNAALHAATTSAPSLSIGGNAATVTNATFYRQFTVRDDRSDGSDYSLAGRPTGLYAITAQGTNGTGAYYSSLIHVANGSDVAFQIAGGYNSDAMYFRGTTALQSGTGYSAWRTVLHNGNYTSYALPLAGGTLTGALSGTTASFSGAITQGGNQVLHAGNYGGYSTFSGIVSSASGGFQTATYAAGRNRIWTFGNADGYGINYYQGAGGISGNDVIGLNFGNATAALAQFQFLASGSLNATGTITATNFSGPGSNLTGTASNLNIGGTAYNITQYTINQSVGSTNSPTFATLQLTRLNFGATGATPYTSAAGEGFGNGITFGGDDNSAYYRIFTAMENVGGNYSKLTLNWHTGIRIGAFVNYGGVRFYNNSVGQGGTEIFSVGNLDSNVRVVNNLIVNGITINQQQAANARMYGATTGAFGLLGVDSAGSFRWQIYGDGTNYGFLDGVWAGWDIRKTVDGNLYLNDNSTYYLNPASLTNLLSLTVANTITGAVSGNAGTVTNGLYTTGGQTIAGITYFSNGESINAYGIRGRFTNEYLHLYNKVGVGHSGGWGQGETSTPDKGLSTYGGLNIAYGDNGISTFNGVIRANSNIRQGADLAMPLSSWSVSGTSTGMVIFSFPGNTGNYGMVHCVFDIYEYNSNTVSTVIVGGHNWNGAWYNTGANVIGRCGKSVRLGVKDSKFCVVFGGAASSWDYGTIVLRKIHNGGFYTGIMDMGGSFTTQQTTTESFSNISGDLRVLRTSTDFIADGGISGTTGTFSGELNIAGNYQIRNTIPTITFRDTDHRTGFIHVNSNIFYILTGVADSGYGNWTQVANSRWPLEINLSTNNAVFGADVNAISFTGNAATIANDLTVNGNTYLGNAGGDTVFVNDIIRIGATDSGDASLFFGEGSVAGSDYGARWYWDSGYTFTWYTRNAGTDTALFDYVTNDLNYINWRRHFHMQNKEINYNAQIHFNAGTRFVGQDTSLLVFRSNSTSSGGIRVQDGDTTTKGYFGYWDSGGGGILNNTGNWAVRYNFGSANSGGTLFGNWVVESGNVGIGTTTNTFTLNVYNNADVWHARFGSATGELRIGGQTNSGAVIQSFVPGSGTVRDLYLQRDGGNVGIGTSSPGYKLDVSGTGRFTGDLTILNLIGSYQNTSVYNSANTLSTTPSRGIRAQSSSIQFTDSYAIAPFYTYRTTGDWPVPYGIGWGTGGESSGIFQRYASNGYSFGDMIFYTGNDGSGAFSFRRHTWEGTTYFAAGSHHLDTELFRIDWAGKATATSFALSGGFTITHPGSGYAEFSNWVLLGTTGFYSSTNSAHLHPNTGTYGSWKITGTRGGYGGIEFESGVSLMVNSNQVGFHRNGYGWQLWWSAGTAYCHKGDPGGGTQATILDSSNVASYALPIGGGTLTGALSGTTASFSGAITQGGNQVLHAGNFATYALPLNPDGDGVCVAYSDENPTFNGVSVGGGWYFGADGSTTGGGLTAKILNAFGGGVNSTNGYYVGNNNFLANSSTTTTTLCIDGSNNHFANELTISGQGMGAYNLMKYSGIRSGDWQTFTNTEGQLNVIQVNNITSGAHTNYPTGVYGYGAVMSWRTNSHSFQLYAAHTGDLAYKTQWGNDNYSGWRRILDSTNYPYAAAMNQNVGTSNSPTFASLLITSEIVIQKDNARNLAIQGSGGADCGLLGRGSSGQFAFQLYGNNNSEYGFLNSAWGGWDLRKVPSGSLFLNGNVTYYLNPASATNLYSLTVANTISGSITGNAGGSSASCTGNAASASSLAADTSTRFKILTFTGVGGDSGNGSVPDSYAIYQQGGSWTHPYPDLCIGYHTGIKIGAYFGYGGTRFYNNSDWATEIFSVGNGDSNVRVANTIYAAAFSGPLTGNVTGNVTGNLTGLASSATTAGNVNGYSTSTGVGANTIVVRDASGYIYGHYINTNVSESENPSINSFFTSNGDGWLRKSTVAHVKATLNLSGTNTGDQTNISGNAASVTDGVYLSTNQSIGGVKTFSSAPIATNIAKAWVYYNKSTTTINASYNVSSVTSNGTGVFTVNFTNAMVDTNYVVAGTATYGYDDQDIYGMALIVPRRSTAQQAGSCRLATEFLHAAQVYDCVAVRAVFYR